MYCSTCGVAVSQGLSYCNYCGAKLTASKTDNVSKSKEVKPELLVCAMVVVFISGLVAITMLIGVMKSVLDLSVGQILPFALLSFVIMLLVEGVCMRLLFTRKRGRAEPVDDIFLPGQTNRELDAAQPRAMPESVTEHTTRSFEPIYDKRIVK
jgi:hypothetical protein